MEPLYPLFSDRSLQHKIKFEEQDLAFQSQKNHRRTEPSNICQKLAWVGDHFTIKLRLAEKISSKVAF